MKKPAAALIATAIVVVAAGCASRPTGAPVSERSPTRPGALASSPTAQSTPVPGATPQGFYQVKKGDTLYSIANYFRDAGWRPGQPWGVRAQVPSNLNRRALVSPMNPPNCARVFVRHSKWKTVREWRALGVVPLGSIGEGVMALNLVANSTLRVLVSLLNNLNIGCIV